MRNKMKIGCLARFNNPYSSEVKFAIDNNFKIMQVWYDNNGIRNFDENENRLQEIQKYQFPVIIHALLDINDIDKHIKKLVEINEKINQKDLIIHPICHSEEINENTVNKLSEIIGRALEVVKPYGIKIYLENNSKLDPIFSSPEDIKKVFDENPELEFLIDIAHIYNYDYLKEIVSIKMPKYLHITDSHFNKIHEHLPLGHGEIDFKYIFEDILKEFDGTAIFEVCTCDDDIIESKKILEESKII